jgi:glutaredoxin-like YruB-family protein
MNIKIYTTPTCPFCKAAKEFLKEKNISFEEIDVSSDSKALEEMKKKSGQMSVPIIDINGKIIVGFDKEKLEKIIDTKN